MRENEKYGGKKRKREYEDSRHDKPKSSTREKAIGDGG